MPVKATVLDTRNDGPARCLLCSISLRDYIDGLPPTYRDYEVQREIVSNVYLDQLVDTVLRRYHIPPIVLVANADDVSLNGNRLSIDTFKILDGLQRTFRLQAIWKTVEFSLKIPEPRAALLQLNRFKFSRQFSSDLRRLDSNTEVLRAILEAIVQDGEQAVQDSFSSGRQWFEVWTGLNPDDEVRKMLMLNAGHKPVRTRHQLELLFLNLLPKLSSGAASDFHLVREKELSSARFSKGRKPGTFHFAHIITSLLSLLRGDPVTPSTEMIQGLQKDSDNESALCSAKLVRAFVSFLVQLDHLLVNEYKDLGLAWMGREVTLAGLFGAIGACADASDDSRIKAMKQFLELLEAHPKRLDLAGFENARNTLDLSKVNIGHVNRYATFSAVKALLTLPSTQKVDWTSHFRGGQS
jgi:hypothetical protein